jgi:uncharacterized membrane-anchored protein
MKTARLAIFVLVALAQISLPASMVWKRERTLREGRVWKFRTAPVDPVDAWRGRYLSLRFAAEEFPHAQMDALEPAYVSLKEDEQGFAIVDQIQSQPAAGNNIIKVDRVYFYDGKGHVVFPFDKLWVNEKNAPAAEAAYAAHSNRKHLDAYVTVRVHDGDAAIEDLYLGEETLRDSLRRPK